MPNPIFLDFVVYRDNSVHTDGQTEGPTDMARSTRLVILIKNICSLWDRKRFLLPVSYFPSVRMHAEISETKRARLLRFGVQIPKLLTKCKLVSAMCHAHRYAHKPPKAVAPTVLC